MTKRPDTTAPVAKILGFNDGIHTCDCCGRSQLKGTFGVQLESGDIVHYGSVCVTRSTGQTKAAIIAEVAKHEAGQKTEKEATYAATAEAVAYEAKMREARQARLIGIAFAEFCKVERAAADAKRAEIFT
uniref:hypothetical protein n=1 Tax=Cupriavidus gilardii TaxID=82541 RepID=UPI002478BF31|nr:hypothetical protein [Cupriavidus gilardii]WDE72676.1 hypothetical protein [Cupriavidus gilardii]